MNLAEVKEAPEKRDLTLKEKRENEDIIQTGHELVTHTDYFSARGITAATIDRHRLGYYAGREQVILPVAEGIYILRNLNENAHPKYLFFADIHTPFFNERHLTDAADTDTIWITEGIFDALSLEEADPNIKAVSINGTANYKRITDILKENQKKPYIVIATDNDTAGTKAAENIAQELSRLDILYRRFMIDGAKDVNELLNRDREQFISTVSQANAEYRDMTLELIQQEEAHKNELERTAYMNSSAAGYMSDFLRGIKESKTAAETPTGFYRLDEHLDGGLYEGLYIIGAISSLGKTSFILQVTDQIAKNTDRDILYFSLEMSRAEIIAKSISRLLTQEKNKFYYKTTRGIINGKRHQHYTEGEREAIQTAIDKYTDYAQRIYIREGIGNISTETIKNDVEAHIRITGRAPIIIIDYLQIIAPSDTRATDKQNADRAVLELKRLSRDKRTTVIGISSFNRANYSQAVSMEAYKESGAIEYSSDVLIGLQLKGITDDEKENKKSNTARKAKEPREIELHILKNRNGALTKQPIIYDYYTLFNLFNER